MRSVSPHPRTVSSSFNNGTYEKCSSTNVWDLPGGNGRDPIRTSRMIVRSSVFSYYGHPSPEQALDRKSNIDMRCNGWQHKLAQAAARSCSQHSLVTPQDPGAILARHLATINGMCRLPPQLLTTSDLVRRGWIKVDGPCFGVHRLHLGKPTFSLPRCHQPSFGTGSKEGGN